VAHLFLIFWALEIKDTDNPMGGIITSWFDEEAQNRQKPVIKVDKDGFENLS